jgi:beta-lactamase class A
MNAILERLNNYKRYKVTLILLFGIALGSLATWFAIIFIPTSSSNFGAIRENDPTKPFIRPLLAYNTPEVQTTNPFKEALKQSITSHVSNNDATVVSLYYRDLNTGHWFGINQDETFVPASLFKVPLMIAYLKDAERKPNLLSTMITDALTQDENKNETIKPLKTISQGQSYTVDQLLQYMIEYSDNNATVLLFKNINQSTLQEVFSDLDIQLPSKGINTDFISVNNYSFFFRVLYNASYLNHEMSEKALELLSKIDFEDGIRKSIPSGIPIADKFGEYFLIQNGVATQHELHDCGIIYHPKHPYILCVMTKGDSLDSLKKTIQDLSKVTYDTTSKLK